jgi:heptosyltransferase-2
MKILLLRLGAIGDVVQAAMAVAIYKKQFPSVKIDWAVSSNLASFVTTMGVADRVISIDYDGLVRAPIFSRIIIFLTSVRKLREFGPYQKIANGHYDKRYKLLTLFVGAKETLKLDRPFPIFNRNRSYEYFRLLTNTDNGQIDLSLAAELVCHSLRKTKLSAINNSFSGRYVVLAPGGAKNLLSDDHQRRWPIENYLHLAKMLRAEDFKVVLVGALSDSWVSKSFKEVDVIDSIGRTNIHELFDLIDRAACVVTHDSGPLHLTAITSTSLVAIFGPTPANACISFKRLNTAILHQQNQVTCSPCYDGRSYASCTNNRCMTSISVESVFEKVMFLCKSRNNLTSSNA